MPMWVYSTWG